MTSSPVRSARMPLFRSPSNAPAAPVCIRRPARLLRSRALVACMAAALGADIAHANQTPAPTSASAAQLGAASARDRIDPLRFDGASTTSAPTPRLPATTISVDNCADSGTGSLRDAVNNAVSGDTIDMSQLTCGVISLSTGALVLGQHDIGFVGPGRDRLTIDGAANPGYSVLYHLNSGTLHVQDLTIANGSKYRTDTAARGGCIHSEGNIQLVSVDVVDCLASAGVGYVALGGAVFAAGNVAVAYSNVTGSRAEAVNGNASGGAIYALGDLTLQYSTLDHNSTYSHFYHSFSGGALTRGTAFILGSTISNNAAQHDGGLGFAATPTSPTGKIINSTISGNVADYIGGGYSIPPLYIYNSTIAFNQALYTQDASANPIPAGFQCGTGNTIIESTIIANNTVNAVASDLGVAGSGAVVLTNSLVRSSTPNLTLPPFNITDDPLLGPLQNNGGATLTHALLPGSPAIDTGNNSGNLVNDQRGPGFTRTLGSRTDIGAVEFDPDLIFRNGFD